MEIGVPFRVNRNGKWQAMDIVDLTAEELQVALSEKDSPFLLSIIEILLKVVKGS